MVGTDQTFTPGEVALIFGSWKTWCVQGHANTKPKSRSRRNLAARACCMFLAQVAIWSCAQNLLLIMYAAAAPDAGGFWARRSSSKCGWAKGMACRSLHEARLHGETSHCLGLPETAHRMRSSIFACAPTSYINLMIKTDTCKHVMASHVLMRSYKGSSIKDRKLAKAYRRLDDDIAHEPDQNGASALLL